MTSDVLPSDKIQKLPVNPWIRFFSRTIDLTILGLIITLIFKIFMPSLLTHSNIVTGLIILFLWYLIEPIFLATWGKTLGRCILNINITDINGKKPQFFNSLFRSFKVWLVGYGIGIPLVSFVTLYIAYRKLKKTGTTYWDKNKFIITHGKMSWIRIAFATIILLFTLFALMWGGVKDLQSLREVAIRSEVIALNKGLPKKMNSQVELTKVYMLNNHIIVIQYSLYNYTINTLDTFKFDTEVGNTLVSNTCSNSKLKSFLASGYDLSFNYTDQNGVPIKNILVQYSDCPK